MNKIILLLAAAAAAAQTPNLDFLTNQVDGRELRQMLPRYQKAEVERRRRATPVSREEFRSRFVEGVGGLPERTPLNARVTGRVEREGYRIEKIIFESQPGFYVTANLYLPAQGAGPFPAILFPLGHEPGAKAYPVWQQILATFARRGYVALAWDQLGQGERVQHWDEAAGSSKAKPATTEHTVMGIQALLTGDALARYTIWDGIRALDYLLSRPEVDRLRVGVTGNSGGGTHTAYLSALDDRLQVAAPSCYITSWRRLLDTIGPQDAEQCIPGFLANGFDHADFVRAFAPKPYLMLSAIRDFFSIAGARQSFGEARAAWPDGQRIAMAETDEGHGYSSGLRRASYAWFDRWLAGRTGAAEEETPIAPASEEELACTQTGQVATSLGGETVFTLNRARARALQTPAAPAKEAVRRHIGWREETAAPVARPYGEENAGGLRMEKLLYEPEPGIVIPAVVVWKAEGAAKRPGVVLASGRGKRAAWAEIHALVTAGAVVLAIDARGQGETRPDAAMGGGGWNHWFGDYNSAMTAVMLNTSLVAQRARDIERGFALLAARPGVDAGRIHGAAQGHAAPAMLHAAAAGVPFTRLLLDRMLVSYRAVAESPLHQDMFESLVPGALRHYDLPGLMALVAPRPVTVADAVSPMNEPLAPRQARAAYASLPHVRVVTRRIEEPAAAAYAHFLD